MSRYPIINNDDMVIKPYLEEENTEEVHCNDCFSENNGFYEEIEEEFFPLNY